MCIVSVSIDQWLAKTTFRFDVTNLWRLSTMLVIRAVTLMTITITTTSAFTRTFNVVRMKIFMGDSWTTSGYLQWRWVTRQINFLCGKSAWGQRVHALTICNMVKVNAVILRAMLLWVCLMSWRSHRVEPYVGCAVFLFACWRVKEAIEIKVSNEFHHVFKLFYSGKPGVKLVPTWPS